MHAESAVPTGSGGIHHGVVGWEDDGGTSADLGDSTNDGNALVRVTLFRGRTPNGELDQSKAQGYPILCQVASHVPMPAVGTRVVVAMPTGMEDIPGAGVVIATLTNNYRAYGNTGQGEYVIQIPGCPASIAFRKNGALVFRTRDPKSGQDVVMTFGPQGFTYSSQWVSVAWDGNGIRMVHVPSGAGFFAQPLAKLPAPFDAIPLPSITRMSGTICKVDGSLVLLGADIPGQVYFPAAYGPDPAPGPLLTDGILSLGVKMAP